MIIDDGHNFEFRIVVMFCIYLVLVFCIVPIRMDEGRIELVNI